MLIYLWIEEYGCFRNQGFSFSPEYDIAFDKNTKQISVYKKKASIGTLVYGESLSLTAIVGNNGAGKSTLLDLIREFLFDSEQLSKKRPGFFIMKGDSSEKPLLVYNLTNTRLKSDSRLISMNHPLPCNNPGGSLPNLIYYSALPEEKYYLHGFDDHQDLPGSGESSENSLIGYWGQNELRSWRQYNLSFSGLLKEASDTVNPFLTCFHQDIRRQISFYGKIKEKEHYRDYIPFPLPDKLTISIDILDLDDFDRVLDDYLESYEYMGMRHKGEHNTKSFTVGLLKELKEIHEKLFGQLNNVTVLPTQLLQWDLFLSVLYNLLYQRKYLIGANVDDYSKIDNLLTPYFSPFPDFTHIFESIEHFFYCEDHEYIVKLLTFYKKLDELKGKTSHEIQINWKCPDEFTINNAEKLIEYLPLEKSAPNPHFLDYNRLIDLWFEEECWSGPKSLNLFLNFFNSYADITQHLDFLNFQWGLSSGEQNLLNLFSRLYETMETIKTNSDRGLMILFDELDSTFHPQWQQRILDSLQTFFNALYPGFYIHIVLTTHSPILLSDLPADHVIFIRKSGAGTIAETSHQQTFAANIATLYYDSFFMEQGSIGSLAAKTIDSLYMALQMLSQETNPNLSIRHKERLLVTRFYENIGRKSNSNYINRDFQLIKSFISSVGEPLWRYKLEQKLYLN